MRPAWYVLGVLVACTSGLVASNEWEQRIERQKLEAAKARPITDDLVIHRLIVPHHTSKSTSVATLTFHAARELNAGFGASVIGADGTIYCSNTSGKGSGLQFPARMSPAMRIPLSKFTGQCTLPPGRYVLAVRFNVQTGDIVKPISVESEPFTVTE